MMFMILRSMAADLDLYYGRDCDVFAAGHG